MYTIPMIPAYALPLSCGRLTYTTLSRFPDLRVIAHLPLPIQHSTIEPPILVTGIFPKSGSIYKVMIECPDSGSLEIKLTAYSGATVQDSHLVPYMSLIYTRNRDSQGNRILNCLHRLHYLHHQLLYIICGIKIQPLIYQGMLNIPGH